MYHILFTECFWHLIFTGSGITVISAAPVAAGGGITLQPNQVANIIKQQQQQQQNQSVQLQPQNLSTKDNNRGLL